MKPFVKSGCVNCHLVESGRSGLRGDLRDAGSCRRPTKPGDTELDAGRLGKLKLINGSQFLLGPPFIFNQDNIDKFDF